MARRFDQVRAQLRITPGAMVLIGLEIGLSLVWLMSSDEGKRSLAKWLAATPENVFQHYRVWTLVTSAFLEDEFISLILHGFVMWSFVPTLERFWGTPRFYRFFGVTMVAATLAGTAFGYFAKQSGAITGLDPFIYASIVAFGIVYAKQQVQFFGALPLTGRQLMFGFLAFVLLFVTLQQLWVLAVGYIAAMAAAALMTSKKWSPGLAWRRWRVKQARAKLSVIEGGQAAPKKPRDEHKYLN